MILYRSYVRKVLSNVIFQLLLRWTKEYVEIPTVLETYGDSVMNQHQSVTPVLNYIIQYHWHECFGCFHLDQTSVWEALIGYTIELSTIGIGPYWRFSHDFIPFIKDTIILEQLRLCHCKQHPYLISGRVNQPLVYFVEPEIQYKEAQAYYANPIIKGIIVIQSWMGLLVRRYCLKLYESVGSPDSKVQNWEQSS